MWDNDGKNINLVQTESINMIPQSEESMFNMGAHSLKKNCQRFFEWLTKPVAKR